MSPDKRVLVERLRTRVRPVMLAVAGDSASGKTTLVRGLVEALGSKCISAMCVDDYHRYDRAERAGLPFTPLNPACNYVGIMEQHLQLISTGEAVLKPVYDHTTGTLGRPVLFEPAEFVLVEGLLPLHTRVARACFDVTVYLDPPESVRRAWKVQRDTTERGYTEAEVLAELARREPESAAFIRPQRRWADIVVRFEPIEERHEAERGLFSATVLLRPTVPHPDLHTICTDDTREAVHLKLARDDDGRPVDALHVHAYADPALSRRVQSTIWRSLGAEGDPPEALGTLGSGRRSEPLAIVQLILLHHLLLARASLTGELAVAP